MEQSDQGSYCLVWWKNLVHLNITQQRLKAGDILGQKKVVAG